VWWFTPPFRKQDRFHTHLEDYSRNLASGQHSRPKHTSFPGLAASKTVLSRLLAVIEKAVLHIVFFSARVLSQPSQRPRRASTERSVREHFATLQNLTTRNWLQRAFFTPLECFNMVWVCYLIFAQTTGAFNNCACVTSSWSSRGGYLDFTQFKIANSPLVAKYWIQGTTITCMVMGLGMGYIVLEVRISLLFTVRTDAYTKWLIQAHLSTQDYTDAMAGLRRVRRFRRFSHRLRYPFSLLVLLINNALTACQLRKPRTKKVLVWSKVSTYHPTIGQSIVHLTSDVQHLPFHEVNKSPSVSSHPEANKPLPRSTTHT
jgi:hypothetical protein